jgi:hypothetical protein
MDELEREDDIYKNMKYKISKIYEAAKEYIHPPVQYYILKHGLDYISNKDY